MHFGSRWRRGGRRCRLGTWVTEEGTEPIARVVSTEGDIILKPTEVARQFAAAWGKLWQVEGGGSSEARACLKDAARRRPSEEGLPELTGAGLDRALQSMAKPEG